MKIETPDSPEFQAANVAANKALSALVEKLKRDHPVLLGTMAIPGMLVGSGLGLFIAAGYPDDRILEFVSGIIGKLRDYCVENGINPPPQGEPS